MRYRELLSYRQIYKATIFILRKKTLILFLITLKNVIIKELFWSRILKFKDFEDIFVDIAHVKIKIENFSGVYSWNLGLLMLRFLENWNFSQSNQKLHTYIVTQFTLCLKVAWSLMAFLSAFFIYYLSR